MRGWGGTIIFLEGEKFWKFGDWCTSKLFEKITFLQAFLNTCFSNEDLLEIISNYYFLYKIPRETEINPKSMQNEEYMYLLIYPIYMYRLKEKVVNFFFIAENLINEKKTNIVKTNLILD